MDILTIIYIIILFKTCLLIAYVLIFQIYASNIREIYIKTNIFIGASNDEYMISEFQKFECDIHNSSEYTAEYTRMHLENDILTHILLRNPRLVEYSKILMTNHMFSGKYSTTYSYNKTANVTYSCKRIFVIGKFTYTIICAMHFTITMSYIFYIVIYFGIEYNRRIYIINCVFDIVRFCILDVKYFVFIYTNTILYTEYDAYIEKIRTCVTVIQIIMNMKIRKIKSINSYDRLKCKYIFKMCILVYVATILSVGIIISLYEFYSEMSMSYDLVNVQSIDRSVSPRIYSNITFFEFCKYIYKYYIIQMLSEFALYVVRIAYL